MKHINVPAQVTTIEDKIVGDLTLTQLSLMVLAIFLDFAAYASLPRAMHLSMYKFVFVFILTSLLFASAIKINGKIVLVWFMTLSRYRFRQKLYVFNKNSNYLRTYSCDKEDKKFTEETKHHATKSKAAPSAFEDLSRLDNFNFTFKQEKKGKFHVYITEK
jgi:hypothetical protein